MSILILLRHGQSIYNFENRFTGTLDIGLTPWGEEEARRAANKLKDYHFDCAYTSMLVRAQESLRIILEAIGQASLPVVKNAALNERKYGSLEGLNKAEIANKYGAAQVEIWRRSYAVSPPQGESLAATFARAVPYYEAAIAPKLKAGKTLLLVAHGNSLRALMMHLEHISANDIEKIDIPTAVPRKYTFDSEMKVTAVRYL